MHEEAPHRLAEMTDLDPVTGEPIELELGAWPVGLWRPPRIDLGARWGPLPPLGWAALVLALIAAALRGVSWLTSLQGLDPTWLLAWAAAFVSALLSGLAPAALLMARPDAARRYPALVLGLLTASVAYTLNAAWAALWALQILEFSAQPPSVDLNMVVGIVTGAGEAIAAVLIAYGLWSAPGPGQRCAPRGREGLVLGGVLLLYAIPGLWNLYTLPPGADPGSMAPYIATGLAVAAGSACQAWAVVARFRGGARRSTAWRSAGMWIALSVAGTVLFDALLALSVARVPMPDPIGWVGRDAWVLMGAVGAAFMVLAFAQGLPGFEEDARADDAQDAGHAAAADGAMGVA